MGSKNKRHVSKVLIMVPLQEHKKQVICAPQEHQGVHSVVCKEHKDTDPMTYLEIEVVSE